jgi:NAD(P)-dependent dehydrogenase (short-subunit alcohol dehydrogenase family)
MRPHSPVNTAGTDAPGTVEELPVEGWDRTLAVNLRAPFLLSKAAFPHMREAGGGTIVNVSSVAGKKGWENASAYCASKFGLTGFTEALADEGKEHRIRAIVRYPGAMFTNGGAFSPEERQQSESNEAPATQVLRPEQVVSFISWFVASPPEVCADGRNRAAHRGGTALTNHPIELPTTKSNVCNTEKYDRELEAGPPPTRGECKATPLAAKERWVAMVR